MHRFYRRERTSAVSPERRHLSLYLQFQGKNIKTPEGAVFLRYLLQHLRGQVVLLWDRALIHKGKPVYGLLDCYPRLHVEWFPAYAPELNPIEFVWTRAKRRLANSFPKETKELKRMWDSTTRRLHRSQRLLWSCVWASDLPWER